MENQKGTAHIKPLSLTDMSSAFVILGLGISLSILVFLIELVYKRIKAHYFDDDQIRPVAPPRQNSPVNRPAIREIIPAVPVPSQNQQPPQIRVPNRVNNRNNLPINRVNFDEITIG